MKLSDYKDYVKKVLLLELKPKIILEGAVSINIESSKVIVSYDKWETISTKTFTFKNVIYPDFLNSMAYNDITQYYKPNRFRYDSNKKSLVCFADATECKTREKYFQKTDLDNAIKYFFRLRKKYCSCDDFFREQKLKDVKSSEEKITELLQCDGGIELFCKRSDLTPLGISGFYIRSLDSGEIAVGNKDQQGYIDEEDVYGYEPQQVRKAVNKFTRKVSKK